MKLLFVAVLILLINGGSAAQSKRVESRQSLDIRKINFRTHKFNVGSKHNLYGFTQRDLRVVSTKFGDLDGDGKEEAAVHVLYSSARYGGNGFGYFVDLFTVDKNKITVLTRLDGGGKSGDFQVKLIEIKSGQLIVKKCEMTNRGQYLATVKYEWNGVQLVEVETFRNLVDECWY